MSKYMYYFAKPILICGIVSVVYIGIQMTKKEVAVPIQIKEESEVVISQKKAKEQDYTHRVTKEEELWDIAKNILEGTVYEGITIIDILPKKIETDQHRRYFLTLQVLGIAKDCSIAVYDYYIVLQENDIGEFYMRPFGIEVIESDIDPIKKEITISVLKAANGWGNESEILEEKRGYKIKNVESGGDPAGSTRLDRVYDTQELIMFIIQYITDRIYSIQFQDMTMIENYYEIESPLYEKHIKEIETINKSKNKIELYDLELVDVISSNEQGEAFVVVNSEVSIYDQEKVSSFTKKHTYTIKRIEGRLLIIDEEIEVSK